MSAQPSTTPEGDPATSISFRGSDQYRQLMYGMGESGPEIMAEPLSREHFLLQASDMWQGMQDRLQGGGTKREAYRLANESYVVDAEDNRLGMQAWVLLNAPIAAENSRVLNSLRADIAHTTDRAEVKLKKAEARDRVAAACSYNHGLRNLILASSDSFDRPDLENWLERWSGGNSIWARQTVAGIAAEVAVARVARSIEGFEVELGTLEDDLKGADFILIGPNGTKVSVDVKTGGQQPLEQYEDTSKKVQIGVDRAEIDGFDIAPHKIAEIVMRLRQAI